MSNYLKGLLTNEEVIQELLKIAHEIAHGKESDKALDLNDEELAFYDALTKPEAVRISIRTNSWLPLHGN